jgi:hypothetical protein
MYKVIAPTLSRLFAVTGINTSFPGQASIDPMVNDEACPKEKEPDNARTAATVVTTILNLF